MTHEITHEIIDGAESMGNKRKPGRARYSSGRVREDRIGPTPEHLAKRLALVAGGNPAMSSCPLDALHERGVISTDEWEAGAEFARLYGLVVPLPHRRGAPGAEIEDEALAKIEGRLRVMTEALLRRSRATYDAVVNTCVFHHRGRLPGSAAKARRIEGKLVDGLDALAKLRRGRQ